MTNIKDSNQVHPFEKAGLGLAPFRFVGMAQQDRRYGEVILNRAEYEKTGIALTTKPGGTCAYCGTAIVNMYDIVSSDGKKFHVGCECVNKTGDTKLVKAVNVQIQRNNKAKRDQKAAEVKAELQAILKDLEKRHTLMGVQLQRGNLLERAEWFFVCAGATGRAKVLKEVKEALKNHV